MIKRLAEFDIIRTLAAFSVIAIHVSAGYIEVLPLSYYGNHLVRYAVPLFIILSGFMICYVDHLGTPLSITDFYRKRAKRILGPFIFWGLLYSMLNQYMASITDPYTFLITLGHDLIWGSGYYHLYFLVIIIQLYLLYPLLRKWLNHNASTLVISSFIITLAVQVVLYLALFHKISLPARYSLVYVRAFPVWLFYFVLGMYIATRKDYWQNWLPRKELSLGVLWLVSLVLVILDSQLTANGGSIVRPSIMLYAVVTFFFFYSLALKFKSCAGSWLTWLSEQSFLIYLMHPLMLTGMITLAAHMGHPGIWAGNRGVIALYIAVAASTVFFTYLVSLTPAASILGGVPTRKKSA
ncbi:MAG: acyltransferase [Syntrophomonadaceae bacterium]|jgi:surface polysaccharide O-acyltransferase-like enzyme